MDRFLLSKVGGSKNRPVDLTLIHSFKRMRHFQPFSAIVEALKSSETLELTDNDTKVRRKVPLPESVDENLDPNVIKVFEDKAMSRSIYAKGFGPEEPSTQFDIEAFFAAYGPTNAVRLRRTPDKIFKGSVFVEFDSEETQKKFLALDPKPKWKGQELIIKSKKEYCDEKVKEIEAGKIKPSKSYRGRGRGGRQNDDRDWRERRAEDQKKGFQNGGRDSQGNNKERKEIQKDARYVFQCGFCNYAYRLSVMHTNLLVGAFRLFRALPMMIAQLPRDRSELVKRTASRRPPMVLRTNLRPRRWM